jgi:hypothetical protein
MFTYPSPTPFSPTQDDLDRLADAIMKSHRDEAERKRGYALEEAKKDAEKRRVGALLSWDETYSFRYRFRKFFSDPRMEVKNAGAASVVAAVVIFFRILLLPFQVTALIVRLPMRPAKGALAEGSTAANIATDAHAVEVPPLRLELGKIRSFNELANAVADYEKIIYGGNEMEDDRSPSQRLQAAQYAETNLLERCAKISHRLVDQDRYAPLKRSTSLDEANKRRSLHFTGRCGVIIKQIMVFVSPVKRGVSPADSNAWSREAQLAQWTQAISVAGGFCPTVFSYEYHSDDGKPHTVRITFDLSSRKLRTTRYEVRHKERKEYMSSLLVSEAKDYLPDEEIGSFERSPSEARWMEFVEYLIKERLDQRPVCMDEQPVRPAAWTLDVEFGYFEVHVGDSQTGPIGDKLSQMVGRLIA